MRACILPRRALPKRLVGWNLAEVLSRQAAPGSPLYSTGSQAGCVSLSKDRSMTLRTTLITGALLAGLAFAGIASALTYSYTVLYYSDATRTTEVGEAYFSCNGTVTMIWGVKSRYRGDPEPETLCPGP